MKHTLLAAYIVMVGAGLTAAAFGADAAAGNSANGNVTIQVNGASPKAKGKAVVPEGTWTWSAENRNGQLIEHTVRVAVAKDGTISGTLSDAFGVHPIVNPSTDGSTLTFTVNYETPGRPPVPYTYTVNLDSNDLKVGVEHPDFSPAGKKAKKTIKTEHAAAHDATKK